MRIVVLGWGSLYWDPRELRMSDGWHTDGPLLPVEFARISNQGRLTLVLSPKSQSIKVLWAEMNTMTVQQAIENLRQRERVSKNDIGCLDVRDLRNNHSDVIPEVLAVTKEWAESKNIEAVIWTDLPPNFSEVTGMDYSEDNVITYLRNLSDGRDAQEYVRKAPPQVRTRMRKVIEERLGWTSIEQ